MPSIAITHSDMIEAIKRSGYLIETEVEEILRSKKVFPWMNQIYVDPITSKDREIDITASLGSNINNSKYSVLFEFVFECENNTNPVVFFKHGDSRDTSQYSVIRLDGFPLMTRPKKNTIGTLIEDIFDLWNIDELFDAPFTNQYCSFQKKNNKDPLIALHDDSQHNSFSKLIDYINIEIDKYYIGISERLSHRCAFIDYRVYFPIIVLGGELLIADTTNGIELLSTNHVKYVINFNWKGREYSNTFDILTKQGLATYIDNRKVAIEKVASISEAKYAKLFSSARLSKKDYQDKASKMSVRNDLESY